MTFCICWSLECVAVLQFLLVAGAVFQFSKHFLISHSQSGFFYFINVSILEQTTTKFKASRKFHIIIKIYCITFIHICRYEKFHMKKVSTLKYELIAVDYFS